MRKVLFVTNHKGFIKFNAPYMKWFQSQGWTVDDAGPGIEESYSIFYNRHYELPITRHPFSLGNICAIVMLHKILKRERYDLIHCHTPMGAVVCRTSAFGIKSKIIYTVHGFSFYKGAPLVNWLLYFPVEMILRFKTDVLVTINNEDYLIAQKWRMARDGIYKIDGVGYRDKFMPANIIEKGNLRNKIGLNADDFVLLYTAQFIPRKNHEFLLKSLPALLNSVPNLKIILVGNGILLERMKDLARTLCVEKNVLFVGGRSDVEDFCKMADVYVSSSIQEGLCVSNLEAMACGLPLVISEIRGHTDVCVEPINGFLFKKGDIDKFQKSVLRLFRDEDLRLSIGKRNMNDVKKFSVANSLRLMSNIYLGQMESIL